jgi:hypothetical protein
MMIENEARGERYTSQMTQILLKSAQLRQHASRPPNKLDTVTSSELSVLTGDDVDGDKATSFSEEGDHDDGPVMPKVIRP